MKNDTIGRILHGLILAASYLGVFLLGRWLARQPEATSGEPMPSAFLLDSMIIGAVIIAWFWWLTHARRDWSYPTSSRFLFVFAGVQIAFFFGAWTARPDAVRNRLIEDPELAPKIIRLLLMAGGALLVAVISICFLAWIWTAKDFSKEGRVKITIAFLALAVASVAAFR